MRPAEQVPLGRLAIAVGVLVLAFAVTVPLAPGSESAARPVTNYVAYVGGKAGKANPGLSPVVVGAVNTQGGQVLVGPGWTKGVETAIQYVNRYLGGGGGVQGHPLVVTKCFTRSAEEDGTTVRRDYAPSGWRSEHA